MKRFELFKKQKSKKDTSCQNHLSDSSPMVKENTESIAPKEPSRTGDQTLIPETIEQMRNEFIRGLRQEIIMSIKNQPKTTYAFLSFYWDDAASWYGETGKQIDMARVGMNLESKRLYNFLSDYDGRKQATFDLTAKEFQSKIRKLMPDSMLCLLEEEDWVALFDDELNVAISEAKWRLNHPEEKQKPASNPRTNATAQEKKTKNTEPVRFEKILIADRDDASSFKIRIKGFEEDELSASVRIDKNKHNILYVLTCKTYNGEELYKKCKNYIEKNFHMSADSRCIMDDPRDIYSMVLGYQCVYIIGKYKIELKEEFGVTLTVKGVKDCDFADALVTGMLLGIAENVA